MSSTFKLAGSTVDPAYPPAPRVTWALGRPARMVLYMDGDTGDYSAGDAAEASIGATKIFVGEVLTVEEVAWNPSESDLRLKITCAGIEEVFRRYLYTGLHTAELAGDIADAIVQATEIDSDHTIALTGIDSGPRIAVRSYQNKSVYEILDDLAALAAYTWRVVPSGKVLTFKAVGNVIASAWDITDAPEAYTYRNLRVMRTREDYYNRVTVVGGAGGLSTGYAEVLGQIRAVVEDPAGITANGLYETVIEDLSILTHEEAVVVGRAFLEEHSTFEASELTFETDTMMDTGTLLPGTLMSNVRSAFGITGDWLITEVSYQEVIDGEWFYRVRAEKGRPRETWAQQLRRLLQRGKGGADTVSEELHYDFNSADDVDATMTITMTAV